MGLTLTRQYVTIAEAIQITGLSYSTINRRINDGTLDVIKWSKKNLIPVKQLMPDEACNGRSGGMDEDIKKRAEAAFTEHKKAIGTWEDGEILDVWNYESGNICVRYESGKWWHYKVTKHNAIWW